MASALVVNASPLILLARIDRLGLLATLAKRVLVPRSVIQEIRAGAHHDDAGVLLTKIAEIEVVSDISIPEVIADLDLGIGESQVLAVAKAGGHEAVLDDLAARRCAEALGVSCVGTLGLIALAKHRGIVPAARPLMEALRQGGLRTTSGLIEEILAELGE